MLVTGTKMGEPEKHSVKGHWRNGLHCTIPLTQFQKREKGTKKNLWLSRMMPKSKLVMLHDQAFVRVCI